MGDGEAETGPLATSWHSNKFVNPVNDGVVLPILHLNGYKIANPTVLGRISDDELHDLMVGYGHTPYFFSGGFDGEDHYEVHRRFATLLDEVLNEIAQIKADAAAGNDERPFWPMIVFRTPKGWTGPGRSTARRPRTPGARTRCRSRAHATPPSTCRSSRTGSTPTGSDELFDDEGRLDAEHRRSSPRAARCG